MASNDSRIGLTVLLRAILSLGGLFLVPAVLMLLPAGVGWQNGWLFLAVLSTLTILNVGYLWRANPDILVARSNFHPETKAWDKVLVIFFVVSFIAIFPVAGLDARFGWSSVPFWLMLLGYGPMVLAFLVSTWAFRVNKFAEPGVRVHEAQKVVDTGPYAYVRHPLYLAAVFLFLGIALALGSLRALVPAAIASLLLVVRTELEDRTLKEELEGYKEYAGRVRYRLVPGVW